MAPRPIAPPKVLNTDVKPHPTDDIGPIYKVFGGILILAALLIIGIHALNDHPVGVHDVLLFSIATLFCLALWRPKAFDKVMKVLADRLPAFSFQKKEPDEE
jgi:hypothetical protein